MSDLRLSLLEGEEDADGMLVELRVRSGQRDRVLFHDQTLRRTECGIRHLYLLVFTLGLQLPDLAGILALFHASDQHARISDRKLFREQLHAACARGCSTMNGWDLFTWFNCLLLAGAAIAIFGLFLKDAKGILMGQRSDADAEQTPPRPDADRS